ncbi:MAG TPA: ribosomal protein L7/L12 [Enhygromyxa sp.]|nr:ribosomal protein L7/L12 [Enhygromyxa sp.]
MTDFAKLAEGLRERGFGVTHAVRVAEYGRWKIATIKTTRELTGWGLVEAKHAVETHAAIVSGVTLEAAERAATKLRNAGAEVELVVDELHLYGFDPADPRRGDQPLERIRVVELGVAFDHGRLGAWTLGLAVPCELDELLASIDERLHAWARARKRQATSERDVFEQLIVREPNFEDRLRTRDDEARRREAAVYGDWLQAQGDPRGSIAAVALAADEAELDRLVSEHRSHLFGPSLGLAAPAKTTWLGPVLDTLVIRQEQAEPIPSDESVAELLATPACACLRSLMIDRMIERDETLGDALAAAACAPGLRELRVKNARALTLRGDSFARLEALTLSGRLTLGPITLPALRSLHVIIELPLAPLASCFVDIEAPGLEHFAISVRSHDFWDQNFGPLQSDLCELLSQPSFARLRTLAIVGGPLYAGFAASLARIPAIATLEQIDLQHLAMNDDCRAELERHRGRLPGLLL